MSIRTWAAGAVGAAAVLATLAAPADADVRRFDDAGDTRSGIDIRKIRVDHGTANPRLIKVRVTQRNLRLSDVITVYLDTRRRNAGPEWKIIGAPASEWHLRRVDTWRQHGTNQPCRGASMLIDQYADVTRVVVPRRCVGARGKIRVAVHAHRYGADRNDWAKARRTFLRSVARG